MKTFGKFSMALSLAAMSATSFSVPAFAHTSTRYHTHRYHGKTHYAHRYCRRSSGTTGLVAGGVGGALVGRSVLGHGVLGTVGGAVGGALAGRAVDRSLTAHRRCYWR
jgi:outer membrane lipoprotein SlyB